MLLISYDISNDKLRTRFSKFIMKYGHRLQYSLYEIRNSKRVLNNIQIAIENDFAKQFDETDSVMIFMMSKHCKIQKYGYAKHRDEELIIL